MLGDAVDVRLIDAAGLYVRSWLYKDRPSVVLHPLLWFLQKIVLMQWDWLFFRCHWVAAYFRILKSLRQMVGCAWLHLLRSLCWSLQNLVEIEREDQLDGGLLVVKSVGHVDDDLEPARLI